VAPANLVYSPRKTMRLTKQTSYAIRILLHCALAGRDHVRAGDIAHVDGITEYNVAKIVPMLVRAGFITTTRGRAGGLKLARPPAKISIGDVLRVTEATYVEAECVGGTSLACGIKRAAPINRVLGDAMKAFVAVLDDYTLADLIGSRPASASGPSGLTVARSGSRSLPRSSATVEGIGWLVWKAPPPAPWASAPAGSKVRKH
jgi:Rrf2 family protein